MGAGRLGLGFLDTLDGIIDNFLMSFIWKMSNSTQLVSFYFFDSLAISKLSTRFPGFRTSSFLFIWSSFLSSLSLDFPSFPALSNTFQFSPSSYLNLGHLYLLTINSKTILGPSYTTETTLRWLNKILSLSYFKRKF